METIVNYIKAFSGDLYGPIVFDRNSKTINCRIDQWLLPSFLNILSLEFKITNDQVIISFPILYTSVSCIIQPYNIKLHVILIDKKTFQFIVPDLEFYLLTEDASSTYIRCTNLSSMRFIVDKLSFIKKRIENKRFSNTQRVLFQIPSDSSKVTKTVENAIDYVQNDWLMDDLMLGRDAWVVMKWGSFIKDPTTIRSTLPDSKINAMINNNECSLCHEKFLENDIVINTTCHHTFHWICSEGKGLKTWVHENKMNCCPCCRATMF